MNMLLRHQLSFNPFQPGSSAGRVLLLLALLGVAAQAQDPGKFAQSTQVPPAAQAFQSGGSGAIGAGDLLEVTVFDTPELSGKARVSNSGEISLPLLGVLHVNGLTTDQTQKLVADALIQKQLVKEPQVSVFVAEYATQGVSVLGEVKHPGIFPSLGQHRLLDYISLAEGLTPMAGTSVTITPRGSSESRTIILPSISSPTSDQNPEILPGDTIFVAKTGLIYVVGDVARPGGFALDHDQHLTVIQAIALAQGLNGTAAKNKARLIRKTSTGTQEIALNLGKILHSREGDIPLQDSDILFVPNSSTKSVLKATQYAIGGIASAAIYHF
jgi:polysaccharide biosynthesis/export protein